MGMYKADDPGKRSDEARVTIDRTIRLICRKQYSLYVVIQTVIMSIRIGNGYDIHQLVPGRSLILGGIKIEHELGLLGHSDADVLTHAIMDAMLGALSLGDIGLYFPPTDPKWEGADSIELLKEVNRLLRDRGWRVGNVDSVVIAERPKLKPHILKMRSRLAKALKVDPDQVGVKATTNEKLDAVGREEGIAAYAVVLLIEEDRGADL